MDRTMRSKGRSILDDEWIYGGLVYVTGSLKTISPVRINDAGVREETIGQFTGLLDKDGREIYERGIVEWLFLSYGCYEEQEVCLRSYTEWHQGDPVLNVTENGSENAGFYAVSDLHTDTKSDVKILGNIRSNPDLIKEE